MKEYIVQAVAQETIDSFDAHNAPELIRCKDCAKQYTDNCLLYWNDINTPDNWYCANGERKETT